MDRLLAKKTDLLIGLLVSCVFAFLSFNAPAPLEVLERFAYGIEMRLNLPRNLSQNRIAIVNIDDKSLNQLGPWPWPRRVIADMIRILRDNGAKLIGLDLTFSENERNEGLQEIRRLYEEILADEERRDSSAWILRSLRDAEKRLDNDRILSEAVKESGNIILPVSGRFGKYDTELVLTEDSFLKKNIIGGLDISPDRKAFPSVNQLTTPFLELSRNSRGLGHMNFSPNEFSKGQVHLLFINFRGHIIPSLPFRLALDYFNKSPEEVVIQGRGIRLRSDIIPAFKGEILVRYKGGRRSFPYYSFVDILNVKKVPAVFEDKIVLMGYSAEGANSIRTPVDPKMPRVELQANIIENLMEGQYLQRPESIVYIEGLLLLLATLIASYVLPRSSFSNRFGIIAGLVFVVFMIGVVSFVSLNIWFKTVYICLSLITLYLVTTIRDIIVSQKSLGLTSKETIETNRMLGLSFQSQGLLDLAFEKFRKCPLDDAMKDVVYNLGLDYERKRMINKAISVYEYITRNDQSFRDLTERIPKLKELIGAYPLRGFEGKKEEKIVVSDDLEIKPTVGRYEVLKELGQGAMGIVYKARDPKINRPLAIKTIRFSDEFEEKKVQEVKDRFLREAEIAGQLSHPSIVSIYDVGEDYDLTYLAMEFLEGTDLQEFCQKGSLLSLRKVLHIVSEASLALDYAHGQGVIHRDVKPGNIMILKNGKVKVTDFGIAKAVSSSQTKSGVVLGTPNYMSPEQINGEEIDGRSDIFSLGVVFFELLTGQLPFHGKTLANLFYRITQARHTSVREIDPHIPKPVEKILDKALTKEPDQRFQKAGDLAKYTKAMMARMDAQKKKAAGG